MSRKSLDTRKRIYFDCILGTFFSIISISSIIYTTLNKGIYNLGFFLFSLSFWIIWLGISLFLISWGLYIRYLEKNPAKLESKYKKDLKAPIV
ncbi:MAG: hypothetical protein EU543_04765 [Promethearchaeota archaeon]|nr:MAG: hypothetical protein EU543_04765 [Candidatus Lokiarchaeota archaeon]